MKDLNKNLDKFINGVETEQYCDPRTGQCVIRAKDGLIERTVIEKKLVVEDGRELLREDMPISNSKRSFLR